MIVLGDNRCGKSSLLSRLDKSDRSAKPKSLLGYRVLHVQNDARDASYAYQLGTAGANLNPSELLQIPVWTLDGHEACASLLKHALPATPAEAIFVLSASIDNTSELYSTESKNVLAVFRPPPFAEEMGERVYGASTEAFHEGRPQSRKKSTYVFK